ncbi:MAG: HD domain-containing protein [Clostridiaceae bacterium]|nr:HD domain-containing protein [Clostridiaceae bacterium]
MDILQMTQKLKGVLKEKRFIHSVNVSKTAAEIAHLFNVDPKKAEIAGLLHDCAKNFDKEVMRDIIIKNNLSKDEIILSEPALYHAVVGEYIARTEYGISDPDILEAIFYHTIGCGDMKPLSCVIYLADLIEPTRNWPEIEELRRLTYEDVNLALIRAFDISIIHVIGKGRAIHPNTIYGRNSFVKKVDMMKLQNLTAK